MRIPVTLALIAWSLHSYIIEARPAMLPYCFVAYFLLDLPYCTPVFKVHHLLGASVACYGIVVPDTPMAVPMIGTEVSSPLFIALRYCPDQLKPPLQLVFMGTFFVFRIYRYGNALLEWTPYAYPYPEVGMVGFYGMYAVNLYWFGLMLRKMVPPMVQGVARGCEPVWACALEYMSID